jgi:hypothetical protein
LQIDFAALSLGSIASLWPVFITLLACSLGTGAIFYMAEHGHLVGELTAQSRSSENKSWWRHFYGVMSGAWFSIVTLTTVG